MRHRASALHNAPVRSASCKALAGACMQNALSNAFSWLWKCPTNGTGVCRSEVGNRYARIQCVPLRALLCGQLGEIIFWIRSLPFLAASAILEWMAEVPICNWYWSCQWRDGLRQRRRKRWCACCLSNAKTRIWQAFVSSCQKTFRTVEILQLETYNRNPTAYTTHRVRLKCKKIIIIIILTALWFSCGPLS